MPITILMADDDADDRRLTQEAFEEARLINDVRFVENGEQLLDYLRRTGAYAPPAEAPRPGLILLDLNMPRKNGFEVLDWIRHQPALRRLRVYILSASSRTEDIERAYDLGANSYLVKPGNLDGLLSMAKCLVAWLRISHFAPITEASHSQVPFVVSSTEPTKAVA